MILRQHNVHQDNCSCSAWHDIHSHHHQPHVRRHRLSSSSSLSCVSLLSIAVALAVWSQLASSPILPTVEAAAVLEQQQQQQQAWIPPSDVHQYGNQLPFIPPPSSSSRSKADVVNSQSFNLVHALHIGGERYPGLQVQHTFDTATYKQLHISSDISSHQAHNRLQDHDDPPSIYGFDTMQVKSVRQKIWRPSHPARSDVYEAARRSKLLKNDPRIQRLAALLEWHEIEVDVPDVTDVQTLSTLARMSSNAYSTPDAGWYDISNDTLSNGQHYNLSSSFGWDEDGIRGHVFSSSPNNESIIIAMKGTSSFIGGGETGRNDKLNDNLLFSCCCARVDWTWSPVCDCYAGRGEDPPANSTTSPMPRATSTLEDQVFVNRCNLTCLEQALIEKSVYYPLATDLFNNITRMYPQSNIWLTGHSLGGSLAALLASTFGVPCVTFEAPGDLLPARRLHLPLPPGSNWDDKRPEYGITHVYTNSDPIPQGVCTGAFSTCGLVGFALESKCHTGQTIVYDAVGKLGWSVDVRTHRITTVIEKLLIPDWDQDSTSATPQYQEGVSKPLRNSLWGWPWPGKGGKHHEHDDDQPDTSAHPSISSASSTLSETPAPTSTPRSSVPKAVVDHECRDCFKWEYFDD